MICQFGKYIIVNLLCARLCESRVLNDTCKIIENLDCSMLIKFIPPGLY